MAELEVKPYGKDRKIIDRVLQSGIPAMQIEIPEDTLIVLGRGGKPEREIFIDAVLAAGIPIYRREGGGGTVVLDPGNVVLYAGVPAEGIERCSEFIELFTSWLAQGFDDLGIEGVHRAGKSDLATGNRKIGGSSYRLVRGCFLYTVSLLVDPQVELLEKFLKYPPREPDYRNGRSHREFVWSLKETAGIDSPKELAAGLERVLNLQDIAEKIISPPRPDPPKPVSQ